MPLLLGKDLILTPGVYALKAADRIVERPDTIVLGLGFATLVPQTGKEAITVADVGGVTIAGIDPRCGSGELAGAAEDGLRAVRAAACRAVVFSRM